MSPEMPMTIAKSSARKEFPRSTSLSKENLCGCIIFSGSMTGVVYPNVSRSKIESIPDAVSSGISSEDSEEDEEVSEESDKEEDAERNEADLREDWLEEDALELELTGRMIAELLDEDVGGSEKRETADRLFVGLGASGGSSSCEEVLSSFGYCSTG